MDFWYSVIEYDQVIDGDRSFCSWPTFPKPASNGPWWDHENLDVSCGKTPGCPCFFLPRSVISYDLIVWHRSSPFFLPIEISHGKPTNITSWSTTTSPGLPRDPQGLSGATVLPDFHGTGNDLQVSEVSVGHLSSARWQRWDMLRNVDWLIGGWALPPCFFWVRLDHHLNCWGK